MAEPTQPISLLTKFQNQFFQNFSFPAFDYWSLELKFIIALILQREIN